ncbi:unnamed protein product [Dibothriocephalus latus]|uniref:LEM domain-containing protein n=1 Tax=Dibothriocephalus latus TaxID=60516 RepID=A0A3P7MC70_DIBLA|nr:unnamed protein product [Dibothriocephalus latus]
MTGYDFHDNLAEAVFLFIRSILETQMDLTDEELRTELSKYMTAVPPVTATTRVLLFNKLQKFLEADENEKTAVEEASASVNFTSSTSSQRTASPKKTEKTTSGGKGDVISTSNSSNSSLFETENYRIRRFPATEMPEYPGGRLSAPNWRCILLLFLLCIVSGLALMFFYSDPFYHNPVTDFAAQISHSINKK